MVQTMKIRILITLFLFLISAVHGYSYTTVQVAPDTTVTVEVIDDTEQVQESEEEPASVEAESDQEDTESEINEAAEEVRSDVAQIRELISLSKVFYSLILLFLTYFVNKYLTIIIDSISEKTTNYRLFIKRLAPVSRILIWTFAIYVVIAGIIVPPFETVITIAASIGIAVGFASQDILRNIFGGVMIILDRPFQVGDKIQVGDHYGEVLSIGLRSSRVVTPDDSIVSLPNGELMNRAVSNANSSALDCQVVAEIFLPATVDIQQVKQIAFRAVYASSYTYLNKPVEVIVLNEMLNRQYVVKLRVKAYVVDIRYEFLFKSDMTEMILNECNRLGYIPKNGVEQPVAAEKS
ncbi:MAG: mechanosensitive ion channel family protein [Balneolaceae bacterium]|nr:MAG: mechanosensitive ion channel family protein [Balneolaceae bacterium]